MQKRILILGASCFFKDAYIFAKNNGIYTVAVDLRDGKSAICKKIADVSYQISTKDIDALLEIAKKERINGIYAGASETNMPTAIEIANRLGISFYCNKEQWSIGTNKRKFKEMCIKHEIPVTVFYDVNDKILKEESRKIKYPVVTKPVDSNGSTGISICKNEDEFIYGYNKAKENSKLGDVLTEVYMPYDSVIIHYTMIHGKAYFCGVSDKKSKKIKKDGAPVMALQFFPSDNERLYLEMLDKKVRTMFEQEGFNEGPIWIEAFFDGNQFVFNEMGYRYGGSMTYHPVKYLTGIDQIAITMGQSDGEISYHKPEYNGIYCIAPIHIKPGKIYKIIGLDKVIIDENIFA